MDDSGRREEFGTGAVRDAGEGKPRPDLVSPFALLRLGAWLAEGADKYDERNWEKGIPQSRCLASLWRHLLAWMCGDDGEDHLVAVLCNAMFLVHNDEAIQLGLLPAELDDLPHYLADKPWEWSDKSDGSDGSDGGADRPMRLYLAGPMRGYPEFNFPAFHAAAKRLRDAGYEVVSPAEMDAMVGISEESEITGAMLREAMRRDLRAICGCDGLALLDGWEASKGCAVEVALAKFLDVGIQSVADWYEIATKGAYHVVLSDGS